MSGLTVRLRYAKVGKVRWTSHRDAARIWERALRRAELAVAYTEGFSPRPRLHFGLALPTGYESDAELLEVDLAAASALVDLAALPALLTDALPVGFTVTAAVALAGGEPSLQQDVTSCSWRIELRDVTRARAHAAVDAALAAATLPLARSRKGHETLDDLRPGILALRVDATTDDGPPVLLADLATQPRALRPSELLAACFPDVVEPLDITHRVLRTHQWIERGGARREPLPVSATPQPQALGACA
ncbi:MAG TPA: TIGR03936 family radical SAM-associated protein [Acidimicrobiales bacterium]